MTVEAQFEKLLEEFEFSLYSLSLSHTHTHIHKHTLCKMCIKGKARHILGITLLSVIYNGDKGGCAFVTGNKQKKVQKITKIA